MRCQRAIFILRINKMEGHVPQRGRPHKNGKMKGTDHHAFGGIKHSQNELAYKQGENWDLGIEQELMTQIFFHNFSCTQTVLSAEDSSIFSRLPSLKRNNNSNICICLRLWKKSKWKIKVSFQEHLHGISDSSLLDKIIVWSLFSQQKSSISKEQRRGTAKVRGNSHTDQSVS